MRYNLEKQDLVVIGGGTSGYMVAAGALRFGLKVILIEKNSRLGGSALHFGCVPSKALLHVAQIAHNIQHAQQFGLEGDLLSPDLNKINTYISDVVSKLQQQESQEAQYMFRQLNGQILYGNVKFIDQHTVQINDQIITAKKFVIATGSSTMKPEIRGLNDIGYITNETVFTQQQIPKKLIIIGDKPSAIEFAQAFARLGSKVVIVAEGDSILPKEDAELVNQLKEHLIREGIEFYLNTRVMHAFQHKQNKVLDCLHDSGEKFAISGAEILVAMGNRPNIAGLGLENAGVAFGYGGIVVNNKLRTSRRNIYALGDVTRGQYKLTHAAEYQANIVLSNLVFRYPARVKLAGCPYVIFTSPEFAHVGINEQQAKDQKMKHLCVTRFDFKDLDSAIIQNAHVGMIKVVTSRGKIIGVTILGPQASNLIAEWGLAINVGANMRQIATTLHAYPTLAQINKRVANKQIARSLFSVFNRRVVSILHGVFA